jgi:hypothetical protein
VPADPFEDALSQLQGGQQDPFESALADITRGQGKPGLAAATANAQTQTFGFADEIQAAAETIPYAFGEATSGRGVQIDDLVDYYKYRRDQYRKEAGELAQSNPTATAVGTGIGIASQLAAGGVNPASVGRAALTGGRALLSVEGATAAARGLFSAGGAEAAAAGAAYGGAASLGASEADTASGLFEDTAKGAATGAAVGAAGRGLFSAAEAGLASRMTAAGDQLAAAQAAERDQALLKTGLEGRQRKRPDVAKQRAQAVLDEPLPGDPSKKLFDESEKLSPDDRYALAKGLRQEQGEVLGSVRKELGQAQGVEVPSAPIRNQIRSAFDDLPAEVQSKALEQVDAMIGAASKDGALTPAALRNLIEDSEGLAKYGSPSTDNLLGNARKRVFQAARSVFVDQEKALVQTVLPQRADEYTEALRKYAVYSDFEEGARVKFERANKGQKQIREPRREAPSSGRQLIGRTVGGEIGARIGGLLPIPGSMYAGAKAGEAIADRWLRWTGPDIAGLKGKVQKLERLKPMMEQALAEGPAEVARMHALFMARSPDYRKAIESEE